MRRLLLVLLVIGLGAGGVWLVKNKLVLAAEKPAAEPIETAAVETRAIEQVVRSVGEVVADEGKAERDALGFRIEASRIREERAKMDYDRKKTLRAQYFVMDRDLTEADIELRLATNALAGDRAQLKVIEEKLAKSTIFA